MMHLFAEKPTKGFLRYFYNTSWMMSNRVLRVILGIAVGVWVARYLGAEQFGSLSFALSLVGIYIPLVKLGLNILLVRDLVSKVLPREKILGTAFGIKMFGGLFLLLFVGLSLLVVEGTSTEKALIYIIAIAQLLSGFEVIDFFFQAEVKAKYSGISGIWSLLISSLLRIILIVTSASLLWFGVAVFVELLVGTVFFVYFYKRQGLKMRQWSFSRPYALQLIKNAWPLFLSGLAGSFYMKIDQVMLKSWMGSEAVGIYAAAVRLSEGWYFFPAVIVSSLLPALVSASSGDQARYHFRLTRLTALTLWFSAAVGVLIFLSSGLLIEVLYGSEYADSAAVLRVHVWAGLALGVSLVWNKWMIIEKQETRIFVNQLSTLTINVILNAILIPAMGVYGAALATTLANIFSVIVMSFLYKPALFAKLFLPAFNPLLIFHREN